MNAREAEPLLARTLRCVESVDGGTRLAVATDFMEQAALTKSEVSRTLQIMDQLLSDPSVSNADIKGLLNRVDAWQYDSPFGADAKAARKHLEAARDAIACWIGKE